METFSITATYIHHGITFIRYPRVQAESEEKAIEKIKAKYEELGITDAVFSEPINTKYLKA